MGGWVVKNPSEMPIAFYSVFSASTTANCTAQLRFLAVVLVGFSLGVVGGVKERKTEAACVSASLVGACRQSRRKRSLIT